MSSTSLLVADTHVVAWYVLDPGKIPAAAVDALEARMAAGEPVLVSAYSVLELVYMREKGKLTGAEFDAIRAVLDDPDGPFVVVPVDDDVAIGAGGVPRSYQDPNGTDEIENGDPGDRTIVATALKHTAALVTADRKLRVLGAVLDGLTVIWSGTADEPAET